MKVMVVERFRFVSAVHIVLIRDDKILLLRRFNTEWGNGSYSLIAGHIDGMETARSAAVRELKEESGLRAAEEDLEFVHVMHRLGEVNERIEFFFRLREQRQEPRNMEPGKCDDMGWFPVKVLPENTLPYIRLALRNIGEE
ncbi:NUDIX hydrolase [mine drainage metagenome]|uniref:NUDIX hydrolase n=1 Tax=mine drainage metagenome TaxID=410659 RepID=T1ALQ0_9ZZZZ